MSKNKFKNHYLITILSFLSRYSPSKDVSMITAKEQKKSVCQYQTYQPRIFTYIYFRDYKMKPIGLLIERFGVIAIEE